MFNEKWIKIKHCKRFNTQSISWSLGVGRIFIIVLLSSSFSTISSASDHLRENVRGFFCSSSFPESPGGIPLWHADEHLSQSSCYHSFSCIGRKSFSFGAAANSLCTGSCSQTSNQISEEISTITKNYRGSRCTVHFDGYSSSSLNMKGASKALSRQQVCWHPFHQSQEDFCRTSSGKAGSSTC